ERLSRRYAGVLELDDAKQDALMHLAERPEMVKHFLSTKGLGAKAIYRSIYGTVGDRYARLAGRVDRHTSLDDELEAGRLRPSRQTPSPTTATRSRSYSLACGTRSTPTGLARATATWSRGCPRLSATTRARPTTGSPTCATCRSPGPTARASRRMSASRCSCGTACTGTNSSLPSTRASRHAPSPTGSTAASTRSSPSWMGERHRDGRPVADRRGASSEGFHQRPPGPGLAGRG